MVVDKYNELSCEIMNREMKADLRRNGWLRGCKRMIIWIKADKRRMGGRETTKRGRVTDRQIHDWLRGCNVMEIRTEAEQQRMDGAHKMQPEKVTIHHATTGVTTYSSVQKNM